MNVSKELKTTTDIVKQILQRYPEARNSDNVLYLQVCTFIGKGKGLDINAMSMPHFLLNLKDYGMPQFESVRRTRQKIQAVHPELAASSNVEGYRVINERVYRNYARGHE